MRAGVDEAGRGPVLGPLVVAGVRGDPSSLPDGVDDSKALTPATRETLYDALVADDDLSCLVRVLPAWELDRRMRQGTSLTEIEIDAFLQVLEALDAPEAIVDALDSRPDRLGARLTRALEGFCQVTAKIGADASDPLVGAASILAKVTRDRAMTIVEAEIGQPVGSGYPSDPATRGFLEAWRTEHTHPPPHTRTTWSTIQRLGFGNASLVDFSSTSGGRT